MPNSQSDFQELLSAAWRDVLKQAQVDAAREQRPARHAREAFFVRFAMLAIWFAGILSCFFLAWSMTGGSLLLTGLILLLPIVAWRCCGFYRWGLLLPLSLMALLALQAAFLLW